MPEEEDRQRQEREARQRAEASQQRPERKYTVTVRREKKAAAGEPPEPRYCGMTVYQWWSTIIQVGILGATVIYAIYAGGQWNATNEIASLTERQMIADHRPWIFPYDFAEAPPDMKSGGRDGRYVVQFKNYGPAPALGVFVTAHTTEYSAKLPGTPDPGCDKPWAVPRGNALGPNENRMTIAGHVEPADEGGKTRASGDPDLWGFGRIDYVGVFGEPHATIFCLALWRRAAGGFYYSVCPESTKECAS